VARTPKVVEDRREQIIDAAIRVFAQRGFTRATNKDIAQEAGITPGLIYYYFESKGRLLEAIFEARSPIRLLDHMSPDMLSLPPEVFLRALLIDAFAIIEQENFVQLIRIVLPEVLHGSADIRPVTMTFFQRILTFLTHYFESRSAQGALRPGDASLTAQIFFSSVLGFVLRRYIFEDPLAQRYSPEHIADAIVTTVLHGILADA
jgi:AcrR family transcriptional regulator